MYKKGLVRLLNVIIILAMILLVYMIVYPNYKSIAKGNKIEDVKTNMYRLQVAIENYAAFNNGRYPILLKDFREFIDKGSLPENPYTQVSMTDDEVIKHIYDDPVAYENKDIDGPNAELKGEPGSIFYAIYRSPGDSTFVVHYSIIGIAYDGKPIIYVDPGQKKHIFLLYE